MMHVTWDSANLELRLGRINDALGNLTPVWGTIHEIAVKFFRAIFASEGAYPSGRKWMALSPSYAAWKRRTHGELPILQLSGHLVESMAGGPDHIYRFGPSFMETGTRDVKARTHQWGYAPRHIPARPIIQRPSRAEGERIVDAILAWIFGEARQVR